MPRSTRLRDTRSRDTRLRDSRLRVLTALAAAAAIAAAGLVSAGPASADAADPDLAATPDATLTSAPVDPGTRLTEFPLPNPSSLPNDVVAGADGSVWVSTFADKQVLRMSRDGAITTTAQLTGGPSSLASDGEGGAWAAEYASNAIAHVSASGAVTEYPIPTANSFPAHVYDSGDLVFFTESNTGNLGRITQSTGAIVEFPIVGAMTLWAIDGIEGRLFVSDTGANGVRQLDFDGTVLRENSFTGYRISRIASLEIADGVYSGLVTTEVGVMRFGWGSGFNLYTILGAGRSGVTGAVDQGHRTWAVDSAEHTMMTVDGQSHTAEYEARTTGILSEPALTDGQFIWVADQGSGRLLRLDTVVVLAVTRHDGADRYELASRLVHDRYPSGSETVFVASGETFPDALSVGPIAATLQAPLLLSAKSVLLESVRKEVAAQHPKRIFVIGGPASLSDSTLNEIQRAAPTAVVERIGGADRFAVSQALQARVVIAPVHNHLYVADGRNFPDALSAGPAAALTSSYVLLVNGGSSRLTETERSIVERYRNTRISIVGGVNSVSAGIESQIGQIAFQFPRFGGADRFAVSEQVADQFALGIQGRSTAYLASGTAFADALAGGAVAGRDLAPLLLAHRDCVPASTLVTVLSLGVSQIELLGGENTLTNDVAMLKGCA